MTPQLEHKIRQLISRIPRAVAQNFRELPAGGEEQLRACLETNCFLRGAAPAAAPEVRAYLASEAGQKDLGQHLFERLRDFRSTVIPWLCHLVGLNGRRVLEIGCGTGSSTVALAEQNAAVLAIDIDEPSLAAARERCRLYGVTPDIRLGNGSQLRALAGGQSFDLIVYMACVEHMTVPERLASFQEAWSLLPPGGHLCVVETPNRLWLHDAHTSWLPFYLWLPDELAYLYSSRSPRASFNRLYEDKEFRNMESFHRQGRGASYHEFEVALGPLGGAWTVRSGLRDFLIRRNPLWLLAHLARTPIMFQRALRRAAPGIPAPFFEQNLDLLLQKPFEERPSDPRG